VSSKEIQAYRFGPFRLDVAERQLLRDGRHVPLTSKVFDILLLLVQNSGRVVLKEELMQQIWPDIVVEENNLTVNMSALRKALGKRDNGPEYIETVPRRGYRFISVVEKVLDESDAVRDVRYASAAVEERASVREQQQQQQVANSLAVLPLTNASSDPNLEYFSDGISESIINSLSRLPQLRVMARNTSFRFRGADVDAQKAGREMNVRAVLVGRVLRLNGRIIISTELVDVADGAQLWGEQYNRKAADILDVQTEIAKEVSEKLRLRLTEDEQKGLAKQPTENIEAYHLYLKGRYFWNKYYMKQVQKGLAYFQQAIDLDPGYALAYAGVADSYYRLSSTQLRPTEAFPRAKAAALKALELDETLSEAHASLGLVKLYYDHDFHGAEMNYRRAIETNPNASLAHQRYGTYLMYMARFEESLREFKLAHELDPLSLQINVNIGSVLLLTRRFGEAVGQYQKTLDIDPNYYPARYGLGCVASAQGNYTEAVSEFEKVYQLEEDNDIALGAMGRAYALAGNKSQAEKALKALKTLAKRKYVSSYSFALVHTGLGQDEQALKAFDKGYEERDDWMVTLNVMLEFEGLRRDTRFKDLLRRIGFAS
jgi:TolB-like protein/Tfp pilus assembly protein PilF